jgi:hypothetical protein
MILLPALACFLLPQPAVDKSSKLQEHETVGA